MNDQPELTSAERFHKFKADVEGFPAIPACDQLAALYDLVWQISIMLGDMHLARAASESLEARRSSEAAPQS